MSGWEVAASLIGALVMTVIALVARFMFDIDDHGWQVVLGIAAGFTGQVLGVTAYWTWADRRKHDA